MIIKKMKYIIIYVLLLSIGLTIISPLVSVEAVSMESKFIETAMGENIEIPINPVIKDEEMRGVWISTVYNLDFPSKPNLSPEEFKKEYMVLLNNLEEYNLNSVIFQVRPKLDAFYKSEINPWSNYLTGEEGKNPGWDPMEWMIEKTHERGMAFEAWFNPYRVTTAKDDDNTKETQLFKLSDKNWAKRNPEHVFKHDGRLYLNPANPEVIKHVNESIMEVVYNYDVDGVHLDDYFYPTVRGQAAEEFYCEEEKLSFSNSGEGFAKLSDWRRENVNDLIETLSKSIRNYNDNNNKNVQFGISPFGIWGHEANHPVGCLEGTGSKTPVGSNSSYKNHFADTKKWVKEGWIDYIAPQIYWTFDQKAAPYGELVKWWSNVVKGTDVNLYIGQATYKQAEGNGSWSNPMEISNQLSYNSLFEEVKGSIHFRYKSLKQDKNLESSKNIALRTLKENHYSKKAKVPKRKANNNEDIKAPYEIQVKEDIQGNIIFWKDYKNNSSSDYILYREDKNGDEEIVAFVPRQDGKVYLNYLDDSALPNKVYKYSISSRTDSGTESSKVSVSY